MAHTGHAIQYYEAIWAYRREKGAGGAAIVSDILLYVQKSIFGFGLLMMDPSLHPRVGTADGFPLTEAAVAVWR